jgi:hypothetical protein
VHLEKKHIFYRRSSVGIFNSSLDDFYSCCTCMMKYVGPGLLTYLSVSLVFIIFALFALFFLKKNLDEQIKVRKLLEIISEKK